jgi:SpoVK/Ycf46/Vps4 family AAA+-type ATPase
LSNPSGIAFTCSLPDEALARSWEAIKTPPGLKKRLLGQALLSLVVRQRLSFEVAPLHGLILLPGPPGTGKTTLSRGLAHQIDQQLPDSKCIYVEVDPHALTSASLGNSQKAVIKLFERTIPEYAVGKTAIVLLDEIEALAPDRQQLSLEANPIDVHRATDAVLAGMDHLARNLHNVLLVATTNFPKALDRAVVSRADHIEEIDRPNLAAREAIIEDTLRNIASVWKDVRALIEDAHTLARAADGLDGRQIRKAIFAAAASDLDVAKDLNRLSGAHIKSAFITARKSLEKV